MKSIKWILLTAVVTTALLFLYYSNQITNAEKISYGISGDGYKNYYTLAYYLENDEGTHFSGMNYPYGENVLFTDNQPAVAWLLKPVCRFFPSITKHIHGFLGWVIFFSVVISAIVLYLILAEMYVENWIAVCFAVFIALLSPQLKRLLGHYSLAYSFFIPSIIYFTIKLFKTSGATKYFLFLTAFITFFSFVHIYYLAMAGMFLITTGMIYVLANIKNIKDALRIAYALILSGTIPFVVLKLFLFFTDSIADRPSAPWGFQVYCSSLVDIIANKYSFTGEILAKLFPGSISYQGEGLGYIGFIAVASLVAVLATAIYYAFSKSNYFKIFFPFNYLLPASFCVLLFAMAFPFKFEGFEKYHDLLPTALKQFRALGRFSWVFYYTATIFSAVFLYSIFIKLRESKGNSIAYVFIIAIIAIWFADVNMVSVRYSNEFKRDSPFIDEAAEKNKLLTALSVSGKTILDYQAIFPLPLFLNGSERLYIESDLAFDAMKISLYTGLPLACGQLSRTSEEQTFKMAGLMADNYLPKEILKGYKNNKPLLMMYANSSLEAAEKNLLSKANYLFTIEGINYYELPLNAFHQISDSIKRSIAESKKSYFNHGNYLSQDSTDRVVLLDFEKERFADAVFGKGARNSNKCRDTLYFNTIPNPLLDSVYEISFWAYANKRRAGFPALKIVFMDKDGNNLESLYLTPKVSYNIYDKWARSKYEFVLNKRIDRLKISEDEELDMYDEVMIRPKSLNVISHYNSSNNFSFNNFPIR